MQTSERGSTTVILLITLIALIIFGAAYIHSQNTAIVAVNTISSGVGSQNAAANAAQDSSGVKVSDLKNLAYDLSTIAFYNPEYQNVQLKNGNFSSTSNQTYKTGYTETVQRTVNISKAKNGQELVAIGDLNNDRDNDGVIFLSAHRMVSGSNSKDNFVSTSSGMMTVMEVVTYENGQPKVIAHAYPEDHLGVGRVQNINIKDGIIYVTFGSALERYKLVGNVLVLIGPYLPIESDIASWKTYAFPKSDFSFKYPSDLKPKLTSDGVQFDFPAVNSQTTLSASVRVIDVKAEKFADCVVNTDEIGGVPIEINLNGNAFYTKTNSDGAAGHSYELTTYNSWQNNHCYSFILNQAIGNPGARYSSPSVVNEVSASNSLLSRKYLDIFSGIVNSARF